MGKREEGAGADPQPQRLVDTMKQAAAVSGVPMSVLAWAKKSGCPAFKPGSRVNLDELETWLAKNGTRLHELVDDLPDKDRADVMLKLARLEEQKIINAKLTGELQPIKIICEKLRAISEELKMTLQLRLVEQLPAHNAGLDAGKQRENNRAVFVEICNRFQAFAKEYEEVFRQYEQKQTEQKAA